MIGSLQVIAYDKIAEQLRAAYAGFGHKIAENEHSLGGCNYIGIFGRCDAGSIGSDDECLPFFIGVICQRFWKVVHAYI